MEADSKYGRRAAPRPWPQQFDAASTPMMTEEGEVFDDKTIVEFNHTKEHNDGKTNKYYEHHPGFLDRKSHQDNYCIPCCFKKWDAPSQKKRRDQCDMTNMDVDQLSKKSEKDKKSQTSMLQTNESDDYLVDVDVADSGVLGRPAGRGRCARAWRGSPCLDV